MSDLDFPSILSESSRSLIDYTAAMVGNDPNLFKKALDLAYQQKPPLCMRAVRVVDACSERNPALIRPYLVDIVRNLPGLSDMAVKRTFMRILIRHSWVEDDEAMGTLVDTLFRWLRDDNQSVAVKAYGMAILGNIIKVLPDLKNEMIVVLEDAIPNWDSAALRHSGKKVLKELRKSNFREPED
jgi:hypothetical protein